MNARDNCIAIIGMAGRFPGAATLEAFWTNLREGVESIEFFNEEDREPGLVDAPPHRQDSLVRAAGVLEGIELFDAELFGISDREAEILDPQHRLFLECAWEAIENAGYCPGRLPGEVGVFAGCGANMYLLNLLSRPDIVRVLDPRQLLIANDKDYLATRLSYRLGLTGPSVTVQTACSTSLVAVHLACQSLLNRECDFALAGGVSLRIPQRAAYHYVPGGIDSRDGHCRAFDAQASGTVPGSGVGIVVMRREADAVNSRDHVRAVVCGSAVNNDGGRRAGYTAPSVSGQAAVIAEAQGVAGVAPEQIGFIEAHGTGTLLGDPIETAALAQVFRCASPGENACAIGSVKTNIGHLDAASGIAGLIKTVLALEQGEIPPSLNFKIANPNLGLQSTPLYVEDRLRKWPRAGRPRCAGVSSFGIGGTNAHVVLEEAPPPVAGQSQRRWHLLPVSARSAAALHQASERLADFLSGRNAPKLADAAFTLQSGRVEFAYRRSVVCHNAEEGAAQLRRSVQVPSTAASTDCPVVFLFPGQGVQRFGMARALWSAEPVFRSSIDVCRGILQARCGVDLDSVLLKADDGEELRGTELAQPALFVFEYALAQLWMSWGVRPAALSGHSLGELVAACIAGVLPLEEALWLVTERGRLVAALPQGRMLAVGLAASELAPLLPDSIDVAAVNSPSSCAVAGAPRPTREFATALQRKGVLVSELRTSHAFHSRSMQAAAPSLVRLAERIAFQAPTIPFTSNVTGQWMTAQDARDPTYWGRHLTEPVQFASCIRTLREISDAVFIEVGPGASLCALVRSNLGPNAKIVASLGEAETSAPDERRMLTTLGWLWEKGVSIDWSLFGSLEQCRRAPLPSYPFERKRYWIDFQPPRATNAQESRAPPVPPAAEAKLAAQFCSEDLSDTERGVLEIWRETLGTWRGSVDDNFFDLHGDSLVAMQIMARVRDRLECELSIRDFFEDPTIASLARLIDRARSHSPDTGLPPMVAHRPGTSPVISFAQQRLWFVDRLQPGNPAYNIVLAIRASGALDGEVLSRALGEIVRRHDVLRTSFPAMDGLPVPVVAPAGEFELAVADLTSLSEVDQHEELRHLCRHESATAFDLSTGPLYRIQLIQLSPVEQVLLITVHHIIFDVWSSAVFFNELACLYRAFRRGENSPLPRLAFQYPDFAAWQRQLLDSGLMQPAANYWVSKLGGPLPRLVVPPDYPVPRKRGCAGALENVSIESELTSQLRALAARQGATPFMIFLAAYCAVLHHRTGSDDLVLGTDIANRNRQEVEPLLGFFVNQLVIRIDFSGNPDARSMVQRVREISLDAFAHQDFPFDRLVDLLQPRRMSGEWPLFGVKFVMRNVRMPEVQIEGLNFAVAPVERQTTTFDFVLTAVEEGDTFVFGLEYSTDLYTRQTIKDVLGDYVAVLEFITRNDRATLEDLCQHLDLAASERAASREGAANQTRADALIRARRRPISLAGTSHRSTRP